MTGRSVLQVVGSLAVGGAERVAVEVAAGLAARGWRAELLVAGAEDPAMKGPTAYERSLRAEADRRGIPVAQVAFGSVLDPAARKRMAAFLVGKRYELVHVHNRPQDWQTVAVCRLLGVPALYTVHASLPLTRRQRALYASVARAVPAVVAVSKSVARYLQEAEAVPEAKLRVIYNGIALERFARPSGADRERLRAELGWRSGEFVWISAARLEEPKAHHLLIDAFAELGGGPSRSRLALAGDGSLRAALEAQVAARGLGGRVQFLGARQDVPALLGAADGYACSSITEGHPLSLLEAMAAELPVVAPRLPSVLEIAAPGAPILYGPELPRVASGHDPRQIADALRQVASDPAARRDAVASRRHVAEHFSLPSMIDAYERLYATIATPRSRPGFAWRAVGRLLL